MTPPHVALGGGEDVTVHPACPHFDMLRLAFAADDLRHRLRWRIDAAHTVVEAPHVALAQLLEKSEPVETQICIVAGVIGGNGRNAPALRQLQRLIAQNIGYCDMEEGGPESLELFTRSVWKPCGDTVFGARRDRKGRHRHEFAHRMEGGLLRHRCEDQYRHAALFQKGDEAVQREGHAILDVVVIAGEQGHPQFRLGRPCHMRHSGPQAAALRVAMGGRGGADFIISIESWRMKFLAIASWICASVTMPAS